MKWNSIEPDIKILYLDDFFAFYEFSTALSILKSPKNYLVTSGKSCWTKIQTHLSTSNYELGGILIGNVFNLGRKNKNVVHLDDIIPSKKFENSSISLKMDSEIWNDANARLGEKQAVVGWYHSHPNLGVFFSATDRYNQKASFSANFHLGLVIDPIRNETALFRGAECEEINLDSFAFI
jgi:proteasome lid subunit RPN8/RPN11